jgi:hypothetical protein
MDDIEYAGSKIQWVENGSDTWQIFRSKLIGRLAAKGCAQALLRERPEHKKAVCPQRERSGDSRKRKAMDGPEGKPTVAAVGAPKKTVHSTCSKCGKKNHGAEDCWAGDPAKKAAWLERRQASKKAKTSEFGGGIRAPNKFTVAVMWRIGALSKPLRDHMVVDTGAMNLMVIREEQWFNHTRRYGVDSSRDCEYGRNAGSDSGGGCGTVGESHVCAVPDLQRSGWIEDSTKGVRLY